MKLACSNVYEGKAINRLRLWRPSFLFVLQTIRFVLVKRFASRKWRRRFLVRYNGSDINKGECKIANEWLQGKKGISNREKNEPREKRLMADREIYERVRLGGSRVGYLDVVINGGLREEKSLNTRMDKTCINSIVRRTKGNETSKHHNSV